MRPRIEPPPNPESGNRGLELAESAAPGVYGLLEYVVRTAPTLRASLDRLVRYQRLLERPVRFALRDAGASTELRHFAPGRPECLGRHGNEFVVAFLVRFLRERSHVPALVQGVAFAHERPRDAAALENFFACPIDWRMGENRIRVSTAALDAPRPFDDAGLARVLEVQAEYSLARLGPMPPLADGWTTGLRQAIAEELALGAPGARRVAQRLRMSERTLFRKLRACGTSFHEQVDRLRRDLACELLRESTRSITDIAFTLGFSHAGSFTRAYKRWTGEPPMRARRP